MENAKSLSHLRADSKFMAEFRFYNPLPEIPSEQKLLAFPFSSDRFTKFQFTGLESTIQHKILVPQDVGVAVDLITPNLYTPDPDYDIHPADKELLEEVEEIRPEKKKTRYDISDSNYLRVPTTSLTNDFEMRAVPDRTQHLEISAEEAAAQVDTTFEQQEFVHPFRPNLKVQKVFDVLPDPECIHREYDYIAFDESPFEGGTPFLKDYEDEEGEEILSLFTAPEGTDVFRHSCNYKLQLKEGSNDVLFWFNEEQGNVTYSFIEQKMTLKKKKVPRNALPVNSDALAPSTLKLRFRPDKKEELYAKKDKL